jgi:hypothetical protein
VFRAKPISLATVLASGFAAFSKAQSKGNVQYSTKVRKYLYQFPAPSSCHHSSSTLLVITRHRFSPARQVQEYGPCAPRRHLKIRQPSLLAGPPPSFPPILDPQTRPRRTANMSTATPQTFVFAHQIVIFVPLGVIESCWPVFKAACQYLEQCRERQFVGTVAKI